MPKPIVKPAGAEEVLAAIAARYAPGSTVSLPQIGEAGGVSPGMAGRFANGPAPTVAGPTWTGAGPARRDPRARARAPVRSRLVVESGRSPVFDREGPTQDLRHERALGFDIGGSIVGESQGTGLLECPVCRRFIGMGKQVIAERAVPSELLAVEGANVEMVFRILMGSPERFPTRDAEVTLVHVAEGGEPLDRGRHVGSGRGSPRPGR